MNMVRRSWFPALLLVAFTLRMLNLTGESLWRDEVDIVRFAQLPLQNLLQNFPRAGFNGPLYLLLMRGWFALVGVSDFSLRYFSLLFGLLLIVLVYVLARRLLGRSSAQVAALLMALSPVHIWYAGEGKMYTLQPALLVLALYALLRALHRNSPAAFVPTLSPSAARPNPWWLVLFISCSAAFYVHLLSPLVLMVMAAWVGMNWPVARRHVRPLLVTAGLLILPYLPLLAWQLPSLLQGGGSGHAFVPLNTLLLALFSDWSIGFGTGAPLFFMLQPEPLRAAAIGLFVGLALVGGLGQLTHAPRATAMVTTWLLLPPVLIFLVSLRVPVFQPRYLLWCAPAFYILIGALRGSLPGLRWLGFTGCACIAFLGVGAQISTPIRPDVRGASAFIAAQAQPGDALVFQIPYGRYGFEYYFQQSASNDQKQQQQTALATLTMVEAPYTNYGLSEADIAKTLWQGIGPARRIWLIETEAELWDENGRVRQWFDTTLPLLQKADFRGVRLSLHQTSLDKRQYIPTIQR